MGTSRGTRQFVGKMNDVAQTITGTNREAVSAAAAAYKAAELAAGSKDSGGDLRLSRWGRSGVKLNVGYDITQTGVRSEAVVKPRPMGPWKVLEYGAAPHIIAAGLTRRQGQALTLFSVMAGGRSDYDLGELTTIARGNRNNKNSRRRRQRAEALLIGSNLRAWARHPGTRPKRTWSDGWKAGSKPATAAYQRVEVNAIARVIG